MKLVSSEGIVGGMQPPLTAQLARLIDQISTIVVGKRPQIVDGVACLLAGGHLLIEDVPGVGKTTLAHTLAVSLGLSFNRVQFTADLMPSDLTGVTVYERSREAFKAAVAKKPNLTVLPVWAGTDALYVAATEGSSELSDFASWGLKLITPELSDANAYWETVSWESVDKYQPDLIIVDNRASTTMETALAQPTWTTMKAAAAGQVADWPAFWLRTYGTYASELDRLTAAIEAADENLTE